MLRYAPAGAEDIPVIFRFCEELIDRYEDPVSVDIPRAKDWVRHKLQSQISGYSVILRDDERVGYFHLIPDETYELDDLYILPEFQGQGFGTEVIRFCVEQSRRAGKDIFLYVFRENRRAISLYGRMGFRIGKTVGKTRLIMICGGKNTDFDAFPS